MKEDKTQEQLKELLTEAKNYYGLQKEYLKLTAAEQMTLLLAKIAVWLIGILIAFLVILFLGLALSIWVGEAIGNKALCYVIYAVLLSLFFLIFYLCRRKLIVIPFARMMTNIFFTDHSDQSKDNSYDEEAK